MKCKELCKFFNKSCLEDSCKHWIDYKKELNCTLISIENNGSHTYKQITDRTGMSTDYIKETIEIGKSKCLDVLGE